MYIMTKGSDIDSNTYRTSYYNRMNKLNNKELIREFSDVKNILPVHQRMSSPKYGCWYWKCLHISEVSYSKNILYTFFYLLMMYILYYSFDF